MHKFDKAIEELLKLHQAVPKDAPTTLQLGMVYESDKQYDKAMTAFDEVLAERPEDPVLILGAIRGRADALLNLGRRTEAVAEYEKAYKLQPHDYGILNNFAWVLATAPEETLRDGRRALDMATEACKLTHYKADYILSTLAAACAETGDFASARKYSAMAVEVSPLGKDEPDRKDELKKELDSYKANKKWREALVNGVEVKSDEPNPEAKKPDAKKPEAKKAAAESTSADAGTSQQKQADKPKKAKQKKKPAPPPEEEGDF